MDKLTCIGRDALCERLKENAFREHVVFLLGGPHAGKKTVIHGLQQTWGTKAGTMKKGGVLQLVVRCHPRDKEKVPATSMEFFRLIEMKLRDAVLTHFPSLAIATSPDPDEGLGWRWFFDSVCSMVGAAAPTALHILMVIEQAETFFGSEVYGDDLVDGLIHEMRNKDQDIGAESRIAFIATGRIGLFNVLFKSRTSGPSPVSTLAAPEYCANLDLPGVEALLAALAPRLAKQHEYAQLIFEQTGGQAELTRRLCEALLRSTRPAATAAAFGKWLAALTPSLPDFCHSHVSGLHKNQELAFAAYELLKAHEVVDRAMLRARLTELGTLETQDGFAGQIVAAHGMASYIPATGTLRRVNAMFWEKLNGGTCEVPLPAVPGAQTAPPPPSPVRQRRQQRHCVYSRAERGWDLWLDGVPEAVWDSNGLPYLFAFLEAPNTWFNWLELYKAGNPGSRLLDDPDHKKNYRDVASVALRRLRRELRDTAPEFSSFFERHFEENHGGGRRHESGRRYTGPAWAKVEP